MTYHVIITCEIDEQFTIEELAELQSVNPIDVRSIIGMWPGDIDDEFNESIDELRKDNMNHETALLDDLAILRFKNCLQKARWKFEPIIHDYPKDFKDWKHIKSSTNYAVETLFDIIDLLVDGANDEAISKLNEFTERIGDINDG